MRKKSNIISAGTENWTATETSHVCIGVLKLAVEVFEAVAHFLDLAFFRRAITPSAVTVNGSWPCSHFHTARGETSKIYAPSACVTLSRSSSAFSCWEKVIL